MTTFLRRSCQLKWLLFCILPLTFIIHTVSLASNYWLYVNKTTVTSQSSISVKQTVGLFRFCITVSSASSESICQTIPKVENWLKGVRAMMIISLVLIIFSGIYCLVISCSEHPRSKNILTCLCLFTAMFTATGWIVFVAMVDESVRTYLHACFVLAIVSTILSIIGAALSYTSLPFRAEPSSQIIISGPAVSGNPATPGSVFVQTSSSVQAISQNTPQVQGRLGAYPSHPSIYPPPYELTTLSCQNYNNGMQQKPGNIPPYSSN